jgi:hypothetical protein
LAASSLIVLKVIEYRCRSTAGMLCSHTCRDSPLIMYSERGSAVSVKRCHLSPAARRNRNLQ